MCPLQIGFGVTVGASTLTGLAMLFALVGVLPARSCLASEVDEVHRPEQYCIWACHTERHARDLKCPVSWRSLGTIHETPQHAPELRGRRSNAANAMDTQHALRLLLSVDTAWIDGQIQSRRSFCSLRYASPSAKRIFIMRKDSFSVYTDIMQLSFDHHCCELKVTGKCNASKRLQQYLQSFTTPSAK